MSRENIQKIIASGKPVSRKDLPDFSLVTLLANPDPYDQKVVRVCGFLELEFEGTVLYFHREDWEHMLTHNAVWLRVSDEIWERKYELTERYVSVLGTFESHSGGHMNLFSGAITNIQSIKPLASREEITAIVDQAREKFRNRERGQK